MAVSEFEIKRIEKLASSFVELNRPPAHIRAQLDLGYRISDQSLELFEMRPGWKDPSTTTETPMAKATFVKKTKSWKIYWQRADLKWHGYEPEPEVGTLEEFFDIVSKDQYACFKG